MLPPPHGARKKCLRVLTSASIYWGHGSNAAHGVATNYGPERELSEFYAAGQLLPFRLRS